MTFGPNCSLKWLYHFAFPKSKAGEFQLLPSANAWYFIHSSWCECQKCPHFYLCCSPLPAPLWVPVKWGCDPNQEKQRDWLLETSELQFLGRGDCQQMCQDESGQGQRQEGPRVVREEPEDGRQSRMAGPGRPGLPIQGLLVVRKCLSGPRGGPTASAPSQPSMPSMRDTHNLLGFPQPQGREREPGNQEPGVAPSCVTPESWGGWL